MGAGNEIKVIARDANAVSIAEITRLYIAKRYAQEDVASVRRALRVAELPESWKRALAGAAAEDEWLNGSDARETELSEATKTVRPDGQRKGPG